MLARHGLEGVAFDASAIVLDLTSRVELNNTLDDLLDVADAPDPTAFDPRWPA